MAAAPVARLVWEGGQFAAADGDKGAVLMARLLSGRCGKSRICALCGRLRRLLLLVYWRWCCVPRLRCWRGGSLQGRRWVLRLLMLPFVVPTGGGYGGAGFGGGRGFWGGVLLGWGVNLKNTPALLLYGNLFFNLCLLVRSGVDALQQV